MVLTDVDDTVKEYLELIAGRVTEAEKIVSDLLSMSRNRIADKTEITARELVDEVLNRHPAPDNMAVAVNISDNVLPLFVDSLQIGQVLSNLITNAYQSMPRGGS